MTEIPPLGLGTWLRTGDDGYRAIVDGIELGYRHLDTAQTYGTEAQIGRALRETGIPRREFFITTKVGDANLARRDFLPSVERSLERLNVDVVDLTLIHWPSHRDLVPFESYMEDLAEARARGFTRLIGVSNFPSAFVERAVALLGEGALTNNQVELHPYLQNRAVHACNTRHGLTTTAYMPLAGGRVLSDPVLAAIAAAHGEAVSTVTLAWLRQRGIVAIPASSRSEHLKANLRSLDVNLTEAELRQIDALDRGFRIVNPTKSPKWD